MSAIQQILVGGYSSAKTYSDFNTHIDSIGTNLSGSSTTLSASTYYVYTIAASGNMWGSSWNGKYFTNDSTMNRVVQHACPTQTVWDNIITNSSTVHMTLSSLSSRSTNAVTRNGYSSSSYSAFNSLSCTQLIYWDYTESKAKVVNPFAGGTPTDYSF